MTSRRREILSKTQNWNSTSNFDLLESNFMALSLISQLAHVELTTPKPQESLDFWTNVIGLEETTREGRSVYLRGWGDRFHHTLKLTDGDQPGVTHIGWRTFGQDELERAVKRLDDAGAGVGWFDESVGHGPAYQYRSPGGHLHELFWEVERYQAPYFREPSGLRIELNAGGYRNYEPDWETVRFEPQAGSNVFYRNLGMPPSMLENFRRSRCRPSKSQTRCRQPGCSSRNPRGETHADRQVRAGQSCHGRRHRRRWRYGGGARFPPTSA